MNSIRCAIAGRPHKARLVRTHSGAAESLPLWKNNHKETIKIQNESSRDIEKRSNTTSIAIFSCHKMSWSIDGGGGDDGDDDDGDGRTHIKRAVPPQVDWLNRRIKAKVFVHFRYFNDGVIWMDASQRFADDVDDDEWQKICCGRRRWKRFLFYFMCVMCVCNESEDWNARARAINQTSHHRGTTISNFRMQRA